MRCPNCDSLNTRVIDSRPNETETKKRRRHECSACGYRFTTYEIYEAKFQELLENYLPDTVKAKKILQKISDLMGEIEL